MTNRTTKRLSLERLEAREVLDTMLCFLETRGCLTLHTPRETHYVACGNRL